ncbi:MAG: ferredoxin [Kiritimatiellae bacterium]|nr:ferredoxin [Verrucomicrobiota bacterium]MBU4286217.1 ferredoxin [Verrucomicrobiota bacterium]MBU4366944.1 ferredoxin [Verrucomicrobiota bacterium]MCG2661690.1 ferredoxin [Kiritimatiellia bacterium]
MKAIVDLDLCTGCGLCVDTCPAVFEMDDAVARLLVESVPEDALDTCREAADNCPVEAIKIEE